MKESPAAPDASRAFDPDLGSLDLGQRALRGGAVATGAQGLRFVAQLVTMAFLARQLSPADFGLVAMATAVTGFVGLFAQSGLSMATVQRERVAHAELSTLFWVNVAVGLLLALGMFLLAPVVAAFYGEASLLGITRALAASLALGGLSIQHLAILRRRMQWGRLAAAEVSGAVLGAAAALVAAHLGLGCWSLVIMQIAMVAVTTAVAWGVCDWRPSGPVWSGNVRTMLSFGGHFTGYNLLSYFARNLDNVLLGQLWGAAALGFYSRAYALVMQPLGQLVLPLTTVAVPTLSRLQGDPARFRAVYLRALRVVAYLTLPAAALGAVLADDLVLLVYGPGWERAAGIFQILALAAFWQPVASTAGWIHVARGRSDRMLRWSAVGSAAVVLSFAIGLPWGPEGVARSYAVCVWLLVIPQLGYALRGSGISSRALLDACVRPAAVALAVAASAAAARTLLDGTRPPFTLGGAAAAAAVVALAATLLLPGGRRELADLWALGRRLGAS